MSEPLECGDLVVRDRGDLGIDVVDRNGKLACFFNARGAEALRHWLKKRKRPR